MDAKTVSAISRKIYQQFPEVSGRAPAIQTQASAKGGVNSTYLLTFKGQVSSGGGPSFSRSVRVVANSDGRILKVTTSK
jgi:hypothetical protein